MKTINSGRNPTFGGPSLIIFGPYWSKEETIPFCGPGIRWMRIGGSHGADLNTCHSMLPFTHLMKLQWCDNDVSHSNIYTSSLPSPYKIPYYLRLLPYATN